ncbi:SGNH/GDSL hydrolase family protein [uncultured Bacteroides sp.]|uniref:SGNH/GDSL hydrolase family protein n=1 Tax=uncultured Bacteroides sp. TaxID=162156 RepID=UPI002632455E|nr:SGNH/GDSL hydrolase family protein [uncultured Bacteroides sp.]
MKFKLLFLLVCFSLFSFTESKKKVLIIGDSISIGYTPYVKEGLNDVADVFHNRGNARYTGIGVDSLKSWLGDTDWDVIHFNFGLHDLCYRSTPSNRDKKNGKLTTSLEDYEQNLREIVKILKKTDAKLIFATTTMVPNKEPGRYSEDVEKYNSVARKVMESNNIPINELYDISIGIHERNGNGDNDVHYNKEGYKELSVPVINAIKSAF